MKTNISEISELVINTIESKGRAYVYFDVMKDHCQDMPEYFYDAVKDVAYYMAIKPNPKYLAVELEVGGFMDYEISKNPDYDWHKDHWIISLTLQKLIPLLLGLVSGAIVTALTPLGDFLKRLLTNT